MKNWIHRWRMSRALDEGTELPASTQRRLRNDAQLRRHHERLTALDRALSSEAKRWRAGAPQAEPIAVVEPRSIRSARSSTSSWSPWGIALVAAAAGLLAIFAWRGRFAQELPADTAQQPVASVESPTSGRGFWSPILHLTDRARAESLGRLEEAADAQLMGEVRNVARDARRLASVLVGRVSFAGVRGDEES